MFESRSSRNMLLGCILCISVHNEVEVPASSGWLRFRFTCVRFQYRRLTRNLSGARWVLGQNAGFDGFPCDSLSVDARRSIRTLSLCWLYVVSPLRCLLQVEKFKCKTEAGVAREDRTQTVITRESKTRTWWKKGVFAELNEAWKDLTNPQLPTLFA